MMDALGVTNLYDLNRLHLRVDSSIDVPDPDELARPNTERSNFGR